MEAKAGIIKNNKILGLRNMRVDLHNLHDELLNAGSKEINMNRGSQKCMETKSLTLKVAGHKGVVLPQAHKKSKNSRRHRFTL